MKVKVYQGAPENRPATMCQDCPNHACEIRDQQLRAYHAKGIIVAACAEAVVPDRDLESQPAT